MPSTRKPKTRYVGAHGSDRLTWIQLNELINAALIGLDKIALMNPRQARRARYAVAKLCRWRDASYRRRYPTQLMDGKLAKLVKEKAAEMCTGN